MALSAPIASIRVALEVALGSRTMSYTFLDNFQVSLRLGMVRRSTSASATAGVEVDG